MSKIALALTIFTLCLLDIPSSVLSEPTWTSLRVTYGLNIFSSRAFAKLPRQESKARRKGFTKLPGECEGSKFVGIRYMKDDDPTAITIYDKNGFIAGLQHGIPKSDVDRVAASYSYFRSSAYQLDVINDQQIYFLTAYFIDPRTICRQGRTSDEYEEYGTGTDLYLQNGTDPLRDSIHVPMYEVAAEENHWIKGECKKTIGKHYWYNYSPAMDCQHFFPFTVIYNRDKLTGFAFFNFGKYEFSERFEHPEEDNLDDYMDEPIPQCIKDEYDISDGFSMMHVFFSVRPWNIMC